MKYIGNKSRLLNFIEESLVDSQINFKNIKVIDLFAGTGSVSNFFLRNYCDVVSCDNMTYSAAEQYRINYFKEEPTFKELISLINGESLDTVLDYLNNLDGIEGYYFENYAPSGKFERKYFSDENAKKIDAISNVINSWKNILPFEKYMFLLGILMCSSDKVSNTSGTYGAYLKIWRSMALKSLTLEKPKFTNKGKVQIIQDDVINCVKKYKKIDLIYLDPPYNKRQYASNFHVLENIVMDDKPQLSGKTGLRDYSSQKSLFCITSKVKNEFIKLVENMDAKYIVMSYSTEGLLKEDDIIEVLQNKGNVIVYRNSYRRFKTNSWTEDDTNLEELLFICKVDD